MTRDMRLRDRIDAGTYVDQANMRDALVAQALDFIRFYLNSSPIKAARLRKAVPICEYA